MDIKVKQNIQCIISTFICELCIFKQSLSEADAKKMADSLAVSVWYMYKLLYVLGRYSICRIIIFSSLDLELE